MFSLATIWKFCIGQQTSHRIERWYAAAVASSLTGLLFHFKYLFMKYSTQDFLKFFPPCRKDHGTYYVAKMIISSTICFNVRQCWLLYDWWDSAVSPVEAGKFLAMGTRAGTSICSLIQNYKEFHLIAGHCGRLERHHLWWGFWLCCQIRCRRSEGVQMMM